MSTILGELHVDTAPSPITKPNIPTKPTKYIESAQAYAYLYIVIGSLSQPNMYPVLIKHPLTPRLTKTTHFRVFSAQIS